MKTLPLLSSSFPYFSWETQFGNATSTQLQNGYAALTGEGRTYEFHRYIWNDMVDLLSQALSEAGLSWNNAYGTAKETKVLEKYGLFTAQKFNAMTINIDQIIKNAWQWEVNQMFIGYVARPRFYGVTEKKDKGDYLYGQYIIELARVLNQFIAILKNEADFAEIKHHEIIKSVDEAQLVSKKVLPLAVEEVSFSKDHVRLLQVQAFRLYINCISHSIDHVIATATPSLVFYSKNITESSDYVEIRTPRSLVFSHQNCVETLDKVNLYSKKSLPIFHESIAKSTQKNEFASLGSLPINTENHIAKSIDRVVMLSAIPKYIVANEISHSTDKVQMMSVNPSYMTANEISNSKDEAILSNVPPYPISTNEISNSRDNVTIAPVKSNPLKLNGTIKTMHKVVLSLETTWLYPIQNGSDLYIQQIYSSERADSNLYIDCEAWEYPTQEDTNLHITQAFDMYQSNDDLSIDRFIESIQNGSDLYIRQIYDTSQEDSEAKGE